MNSKMTQSVAAIAIPLVNLGFFALESSLFDATRFGDSSLGFIACIQALNMILLAAAMVYLIQVTLMSKSPFIPLAIGTIASLAILFAANAAPEVGVLKTPLLGMMAAEYICALALMCYRKYRQQ